MKELIVGDIAIYTEEGDSWEDILRVIRKASEIYMDSVRSMEPKRKK